MSADASNRTNTLLGRRGDVFKGEIAAEPI
jgi:hypothetical protein